MKAASKAAAGLEEHHREVIVAKSMENTPTLRTIASETKKTLLLRVDVSVAVAVLLLWRCARTLTSLYRWLTTPWLRIGSEYVTDHVYVSITATQPAFCFLGFA